MAVQERQPRHVVSGRRSLSTKKRSTLPPTPLVSFKPHATSTPMPGTFTSAEAGSSPAFCPKSPTDGLRQETLTQVFKGARTTVRSPGRTAVAPQSSMACGPGRPITKTTYSGKCSVEAADTSTSHTQVSVSRRGARTSTISSGIPNPSLSTSSGVRVPGLRPITKKPDASSVSTSVSTSTSPAASSTSTEGQVRQGDETAKKRKFTFRRTPVVLTGQLVNLKCIKLFPNNT